MNERRRFLQVIYGSAVTMGVGCGGAETIYVSGSSGAGTGAGGNSSSSSGPPCMADGGTTGVNHDICASDAGTFNVGKPATYATMGLHKVLGTFILIGRDAGGVYALSSLCTHDCCDMNGTIQGQQVGTVLATGIRCNCHDSTFNNAGARIAGPAQDPLDAYQVSLECDGNLYVDTTKVVPATTRLMA